MKSSHTEVHNRRDLNRSRRWGLNQRKPLEISIQWIDRPINLNVKTPTSFDHRAAHVVTPTRLKGTSKPRPARSVLLPPIDTSKAFFAKVGRVGGPPPHRKETGKFKGLNVYTPVSKTMRERASLCVVVTQCGKVNQNTRVSLGLGNKAAETKAFADGQPAPTPVEPPLPQSKKDSSDPGTSHNSTMRVEVQHEASPRGFGSTDLATETESEGSEDKSLTGRLRQNEEDEDEEYYTDERIKEWILTVNSSLFTTGHDERHRSKPAEEKDVGTIKIVYAED